MDFWPEFLAKSWGKEFVAGGMGGMAGVVSGYPLDTLRILLQQPSNTQSAYSLVRKVVASQGPLALYRGMAAPLTSITFQNAMVFQVYAVLSRAFNSSNTNNDPPSYKSVALAGVGTGALQSLMLSPVELVKIRLQLQTSRQQTGPLSVVKDIFRREGLRGIYRGLTITVLRDAPAYGVYFWTYEYTREKLHPGCRESGQANLITMLVAGGSAGVASWVCCYPLDVIKSRLQALSDHTKPRYNGILDCFKKSVKEDGYRVLWRGLGAAVTRAFLVNGAVFAAYEYTLFCVVNNNHQNNEADGTQM